MNSSIKARNIFLINELFSLDAVLDFKVAVFKGAGLILKGFYKIDEREMSDVDILVNHSDYDNLVNKLYFLGYKNIKNGRNSFYKILSNDLPPVIIDVHPKIWGISLYEFKIEKLENLNNVFVLSDIDLFITSLIHSVLNHGFFDNKTESDIKKIISKNNYDNNFIENVVKKSEKLGCGLIVYYALKEMGISIKFPKKLFFREIISYPFIRIAFKKHFLLNEYMLEVLWNPSVILYFLSNPLKVLKNVFLRFCGKMD